MPLITIQSQIILVHSLASCFFKIHFNIPHQWPYLPSDLFSSGYPTETLNLCLIPHSVYMPCQSHIPSFDPNNIWWRVQTLKLILKHFYPPIAFCLLDPNPLSTLFSDTINLLPLMWETKFHTYPKAESLAVSLIDKYDLYRKQNVGQCIKLRSDVTFSSASDLILVITSIGVFLKGSDDRVQHSELLGFWTFPNIRYSRD
jgi:hypothetical protein